MSLSIDETDAKILESLQKDGRASFRDVAKEVGVSTPTVRKRVARMKKLGVIKKFSAVIDLGKLKGITAFVTLDVKAKDVERVADALAKLDETLGVYITTGEHSIIVKVMATDFGHLERIMLEKLAKVLAVTSTHNSIVIRMVKEAGVKIEPGLGIVIHCEYCGKEILGEPVELKIAGKKHLFCCKTCSSTIKAKFEEEQRG
ncbi:MAG: AsnC family transcriptional regulator [Candidatus Bathyarchaeia archaeon]